MNERVIDNMIEVKLIGDDQDTAFRKVRESLTRMGVSNNEMKKLTQSAHILHKKGKYYICHFKELYSLDGKASTINVEDYMRRNRIAKHLEEWNLIEIVNPKSIEPLGSPGLLKVIKYSEKEQWSLYTKYTFGDN